MFSVIIPLYNKEDYVGKAVNSVLSQTLQDFELIIINDGSTDSSLRVVEEITKKSLHTKIITQHNQGVSVARNNAVAIAKNEYICFLDADDWWDSSFLQEMKDLIDLYPEAKIWSTEYYYVLNKKYRKCVNAHTGYINYPKCYFNSGAMPISSSSVCIMRSVFCELGGFPLGIRLGEDFLLWSMVALQYKVAFLNKPLSYYNHDIPTSLTATRNIHNPQFHMLFNLSILEQNIEKLDDDDKINDWKLLIDKLRVDGLFEYYIHDEYREIAKKELIKIDWTKQSVYTKFYYSMPIFILKTLNNIRKLLSKFKQKLLYLLQ